MDGVVIAMAGGWEDGAELPSMVDGVVSSESVNTLMMACSQYTHRESTADN